MKAAIASFSNFDHQGHSLLTWFPKKFALGGGVLGGGIMVNYKNALEKIFFSLFQLLNTILDQFVDCKLCVVMYYKFTDQKLVKNYI